MIGNPSRRPILLKLAIAAAVLAIACVIVAVWWWTPLREWVNVNRLVALGKGIDASPFAPIAILAAFVIGGLVAFPVNVLTLATIVVCGPLTGAIYALIGSLLSAQTLYEIGYWQGHKVLNRVAGARLPQLRERLGERGLLAVVLVRIVPIAPYSLVNLVAGSARIDRRIYVLGTAIGMLPGIVMSALFMDRAIAAIRQPGPFTYALFALVALLAAGLMLVVKRRLTRPPEAES